jgi:hypothetical protein
MSWKHIDIKSEIDTNRGEYLIGNDYINFYISDYGLNIVIDGGIFDNVSFYIHKKELVKLLDSINESCDNEQ